MKKSIKQLDKWGNPIDELPVPKLLRLEPDCNDDTAVSLAISAKRQADALERIADILAKQTNIAAQLSDELRG